MSGESLSVRIEGLEQVEEKLSSKLYAKSLREFMERASTAVENAYRENAADDQGRGRTSITHLIDGGDPPAWAATGTNVLYMAYLEHGTGLLAEDGPRKRHWPPAEALDTWASTHGFQSGAQVARIIGMRGGLKPRKWLQKAYERSTGAIDGFVQRLIEDIAGRWTNG